MNGAAAAKCSQLSTTSNRCLAPRKRSTACAEASPVSGTIPSDSMIAVGTSCGRPTPASDTRCAPSAKSASKARAASSASRVLPTPPGPVSVSSRTELARSRSPIAASSSSRPMVRFGGPGKPLDVRPRERLELQVRQRPAAPEAVRLAQRPGGALGVAVRACPPPVREQPLEALQVQRPRLNVQHVARRARDERRVARRRASCAGATR